VNAVGAALACQTCHGSAGEGIAQAGGTEDSMYGREVGGKVLGATGAPKAFEPSKWSRP
jgi:mono/diheme cytochrome c family protein